MRRIRVSLFFVYSFCINTNNEKIVYVGKEISGIKPIQKKIIYVVPVICTELTRNVRRGKLTKEEGSYYFPTYIMSESDRTQEYNVNLIF